MTQDVQKIVQSYKQKIEASGIPITKMYVFGSMVSGKTHKGSDIDICIVSTALGKDRQKERVDFMKLSEGVSDSIEPHPYSLVDFNNKYDPLAREIRLHGVLVS